MSLPGLLGIIENGDLWLTHTLYLNDERRKVGWVNSVAIES